MIDMQVANRARHLVGVYDTRIHNTARDQWRSTGRNPDFAEIPDDELCTLAQLHLLLTIADTMQALTVELGNIREALTADGSTD